LPFLLHVRSAASPPCSGTVGSPKATGSGRSEFAVELATLSTEDIVRASRLLDNEIRVLKRTNLESYKEKIKENQKTIKLNKQLPYLVGNIVEILEMNTEDETEEDDNIPSCLVGCLLSLLWRCQLTKGHQIRPL
ncbi:hypothetical protein E2562_005274, partial [Oryza meyeriana var. granulata]